MLRVIASKALQVYNKDRWHVVYLNFLHSLLMIDTFVAVPCICLRQLLRSVELSKAVVDAYAFRKFLTSVALG